MFSKPILVFCNGFHYFLVYYHLPGIIVSMQDFPPTFPSADT